MEKKFFRLLVPLLLFAMISSVAGAERNDPMQEKDGVGKAARFFAPEGIKTDGRYLFVADTNFNTIRRVTIADGSVTTLAGSISSGGSADGVGIAARFSMPRALAMDETALYVADTNNNTIRRVTIADGRVTTLAGTPGERGAADGIGAAARFNNPEGIVTDGTSLFVADSFNHTIRKVDMVTGAVTTLAGTPGKSGAADGKGGAARFCVPRGLATDGTNLFVADSMNHSLRRVVIATGEVTTLAGSAREWGSVDGKGTAARFFAPHGIAGDGTSLFVSDTNNHTLRRVVIATGEVTTVAGSPGNQGTADGIGTNARFFAPHGITTDGTFLFVADTGSDTIRKVEIATGAVTTLAGSPLRVKIIRGLPALSPDGRQ